MSRKFIGLVTAFSIAVTGIGVAPAHAASDEDVAGFLAGLIVLGTIAAALNSKDKKREVVTEPPRAYREKPRKHRRHARQLPSECLRVAWVDNTKVRYFGRKCLKRNYGNVQNLPRFCRTRIERSNGRVAKGFNARCLRQEGYRVARR